MSTAGISEIRKVLAKISLRLGYEETVTIYREEWDTLRDVLEAQVELYLDAIEV